MSSKIRPDDWDRLFAPNAPRRGGPLHALANVLMIVIVVGIAGFGVAFALGYREQQVANVSATVTAFAPTAAVLATGTVQAQLDATATLEAGTAVAAAEAADQLGVGIVTSTGTLRTDAGDTFGTVVGELLPGDQVVFLNERLVGGQTWFRVRLTDPVAERGESAATAGAEGWASAALLSQPTPVAGQ